MEFSNDARTAIAAAAKEARRGNNRAVDVHDLVIGLLETPSPGQDVLKGLNLTAQGVRETFQDTPERTVELEGPMTLPAKHALEDAVKRAQARGRGRVSTTDMADAFIAAPAMAPLLAGTAVNAAGNASVGDSVLSGIAEGAPDILGMLGDLLFGFLDGF